MLDSPEWGWRESKKVLCPMVIGGHLVSILGHRKCISPRPVTFQSVPDGTYWNACPKHTRNGINRGGDRYWGRYPYRTCTNAWELGDGSDVKYQCVCVITRERFTLLWRRKRVCWQSARLRRRRNETKLTPLIYVSGCLGAKTTMYNKQKTNGKSIST